MPLFRYKAVSLAGVTQEGEMEGSAQTVVVERLQALSLIPISVEEKSAKAGNSHSGLIFFGKNRISQEDVAVFTQEIATLLKAGLPMYPAILIGVAVLSVVILLMWVVPQFSQMFEESGKALPLPTQIVIGAGDAVRAYWWAMVLGGIGVYSWFVRQMREPTSRYKWDRRLLELPLVGDLVGKLEVARFSRTLGTLIGNGVSLLTALSIVKDTLSNTVMSEGLSIVATQLKEGKGLGKPLMDTGLFPKLAVHLVMVGEETGKLQDMLIRIADIYDREVHSAVKRMLALMEPVLILGLGLVIGGIIMSILVAILSVNDLAM